MHRDDMQAANLLDMEVTAATKEETCRFIEGMQDIHAADSMPNWPHNWRLGSPHTKKESGFIGYSLR